MTANTFLLKRVDQRFQKNLNFFNSKIRLALPHLNSKVHFKDISVVSLDEENKRIELFCCITNLPYCGTKDKPLSEIVRLPQHRLNHSVFISAIVLLDTSSKELSITKYNTEVRYCESIKPANPKDLKSIIGFHYDVDEKEQTNHPIFHVQQNNRCGKRIFSEPEYATYITNYTCEIPEDGPAQLKYIRIPTPQMDIFSTVISILADYIVHPTEKTHKERFSKLLKEVYPFMTPFNFSKFTKINDNFKQNQNCLNYWYPNFEHN